MAQPTAALDAHAQALLDRQGYFTAAQYRERAGVARHVVKKHLLA